MIEEIVDFSISHFELAFLFVAAGTLIWGALHLRDERD